jgi:hypothetical protein
MVSSYDSSLLLETKDLWGKCIIHYLDAFKFQHVKIIFSREKPPVFPVALNTDNFDCSFIEMYILKELKTYT